MDVTGKIAVVTGGGRGIGRAIALVLAQNGADVAVGDINLEDACGVAAEITETARQSIAVPLDVTSRESVVSMAREVVSRFGRIDILVNNAGVVAAPGWEERKDPNEADWEATYSVNVMGTATVTDVVAGYMKERRYGKIINISSIAGRLGSLTSAPYSASKAAVINLTQFSSLELAPFNINVNAICPGLLWTPMWRRIGTRWGFDSEKWKGASVREVFDGTIKERVPLGREQTPEDVGNLTAFLASDFACNITGQTINLSGGSHIN